MHILSGKRGRAPERKADRKDNSRPFNRKNSNNRNRQSRDNRSSSRNSAPRMHCIPFSLLVTMKFVQKLAFSSFADVSWNFLWLVPMIMLDEVPAAVDIRIDVGVTGRDSFSVTLWWSRLFDAPVSTRQRTGSVDGGKVIVTKYSFLPL